MNTRVAVDTYSRAPSPILAETAQPSRFYVPTDTCGTLEGSRIAFAWLMRQAETGLGEPFVVVPSVAHSHCNEYVAAITHRFRWTTAPAHKAAASGGWSGGPTLLIFPDARVLGWFAHSKLVTAFCVVQGVRHNTTAWARAYRPEDLTTGRPFEGHAGSDAVVVEAIRGLRASEHWQGLTAASDIALAVRSLRLLRDTGHEFSPDDVEAWALAQGWDPSAARRLGAYAQKVANGRTIPLRAMVRPARGALNRWRRAAAAQTLDAAPMRPVATSEARQGALTTDDVRAPLVPG